MTDKKMKEKMLLSDPNDQTNLLNEILRHQNSSGGDKGEREEYEDDED
jgi:hypothetical protein